MNINFIFKRFISLVFSILSFSIILSSDYSKSTFVFCLKPHVESLEVSKANNKLKVNNIEIQSFIDDYNIVNIEQWLPIANETDRDGDVYLSKIYRAYINQDQYDVNSMISMMSTNSQIIYAEPEYIRKPLYTPNDSNFDNQCSLPAVKATSAWDFWDIPNSMPGDGGRKILLASVDTAVDYLHPDLIENIWINQGEINPSIIEDGLIDTNSDGEISSLEIINSGILTDLNEDGVINLRDALSNQLGAMSPFLDGIDNDGNGKADDLIGWDIAGASGQADNDPYPKEGATDTGWGHGTHVAGILAATTDNNLGIASTAFNAKIMSVKCSRDNVPGEPGIYSSSQAMLYAAKAGSMAGYLTIINCSFGGGGSSTAEQNNINVIHNTYGAIVVAAAGNGDDDGGESYEAHYPSSYDNVISVSAMNCNGNWGGWATYHPTVDLAAPGENIYSTLIGSYGSLDGSSMASPNAASCIGLLASYYPDMDNDALIDRILNTADRFIYDRNPEYETCNNNAGVDCLGKGMVDIYAAIGVDLAPNITINDVVSDDTIGGTNDGDGVINPGENLSVLVNLENQQGWQDATDINAVLSTDYEGVTINSSTFNCTSLAAGEICPAMYEFTLSDDIDLGDIDFNLQITATGPDNFNFDKTLDFNLNVSLNQAGFPRGVSGELISSAAMVDLDNDGADEIVSADKAGVIHVFENDGTEWSDDTFPYYLNDTQIWGSPAIGDLDGDNNPDLVVSAKNGNIYMFDSNGFKDLFNSSGSEGYVTATPALGDIDGDGLDEIIFAQYNTPERLYAINPDGSDVTGFPVSINEKVQRGAALADFNGNGKVDIVIGTDDSNLHLIYDDGTIAWTTEVGNDIRVAPTVLEFNDGEKIILAGSRDDNFYAFNSDGTIRFTIETDDDITSEASVVYIDDVGTAIFFASGDYVYGVDMNGQSISNNWPMDIGAEVTSSITFANISGMYNNYPVVIFGDEGGKVHVYDVLGSNSYDSFPINHGSPFKGSPTIVDTDGDGDLELLLGSSQSLTNFDIKESGNTTYLWNTHRANMKRSGHYVINDLLGVHKNIQDKEFSILKAYPNPFNPSVNIDYYINESNFVEINILNLEGKVVDVLESSFKNNGTHSIVWNGNHLSSGVYFVNISYGDKVATQKLMLMK